MRLSAFGCPSSCERQDLHGNCRYRGIHFVPFLPGFTSPALPDLQSDVDPFQEGEPQSTAGGSSRLLFVGSEIWWTRSVQSIFEHVSYEVFTANSGERAVQHLRVSEPEAVIVHARVDGTEGVALVRRLHDAGLGRENPVILISEEPLRREARLDAYRAGVWDCLSAPLHGEELLLKMESYLGATRVAARARQHLLLDESSGLYNVRGILRWARELGHSARRYHRPFGCAVFAPADVGLTGAVESGALEPDQMSRLIANRLTSERRTSDIIGRLSQNEYIVLATDTGPEGILSMASRFVAPIPEDSFAGMTGSSIRLRAGCYGVADLGVQQVQPEELITRATMALRQAQGAEQEPVVFYAN
ncbi:hypothetical protein BH23GEM6_BH23GEM6_11910 [soil metagenome]